MSGHDFLDEHAAHAHFEVDQATDDNFRLMDKMREENETLRAANKKLTSAITEIATNKLSPVPGVFAVAITLRRKDDATVSQTGILFVRGLSVQEAYGMVFTNLGGQIPVPDGFALLNAGDVTVQPLNPQIAIAWVDEMRNVGKPTTFLPGHPNYQPPTRLGADDATPEQVVTFPDPHPVDHSENDE